MSTTPRVNAAIGPPPHEVKPWEFTKLAAIYSQVLQVARALERENAELEQENAELRAAVAKAEGK